ncbi:hypothetical protein H1V43_08040 [Streptomyces sp. PSKA54]|uniref:Uncharacterized protein n=1 Tax=Streptomyces himalayensis subsp. aureolus TaxID=2758039 RepID=A0A7W2CYD4_9ACTN|nr:DUF6461 domain-containing protein [Streptomyces himalayensis]MBA4861339.1 hypothetical protein [Streptomyces himalayensis subsp. aureolus]
MAGNGGRFSWIAELEEDYIVPTISLIEGADREEVIRRLGGDPAVTRSLTALEAVELDVDDSEFVGVGRTGNITYTMESIGYVAAVPGVVRDLSRGGRCFSVRFDVNGADSVHYAVDGDLVVYEEHDGVVNSLRSDDPRWDTSWCDGLLDAEGRWGSNILALAERVMGVSVQRSWFKESLMTAELPSASRYAGTSHWDIP